VPESEIPSRAEGERGISRSPALTYPAHWMEQILSTSPAKLTLDPAHQPELSLSPRLAELTLDSTYH
jgi:hypothetical protein